MAKSRYAHLLNPARVRKPYKTKVQREIMGLILRQVSLGRYLKSEELRVMLSHKPSPEALRCSLAFLTKDDMLTRKREGKFLLLVPTQKGYDWFTPHPV